MLPKRKNEVCAILVDVNPQLPNPILDDHTVDISTDCVVCVRIIIVTNRLFGAAKFLDGSFRDAGMDALEAEDHGVLVCRWKRVEYGDAKGRKGQKGAMLQLRQDEADPGQSIPDAAKVYWWTELAINDGFPTAVPPGTIFDLTAESGDTVTEPRSRKAGKQPRRHDTGTTAFRKVKKTVIIEDEDNAYLDPSGHLQVRHEIRSENYVTDTFTSYAPAYQSKLKRKIHETSQPSVLDRLVSEERSHFDFCCGAGGMATGVAQSGSTLKYLLDEDANCCNTVRLAFPGRETEILHTELNKLFTDPKYCHRSYKVATVHISYPCKTYSGAHTGPVVSARDLKNEDTGASVEAILKATRGKFVTFEQTDHMVKYSKNREVFRRLINGLTTASYSVRWKIIDCTEHGSPSKRSRLILQASCPGHPCPNFPDARPSPKVTAADVYREKPHRRDIDPHLLRFTPKVGVKWDPNSQLSHTITCSGGLADTHPSGTRTHDMQELAQLAGFPPDRKFAQATMTQLREMIGNAVPSGLALDVYREVHKSLDNGDAEMISWLTGGLEIKEDGSGRVRREKNVLGGQEIIVIDDDQGDVIVLD
ncbi:hypothetical protein LTR08_000613 [Meristemomyces frigidus]|nr:hypothetical protein LTR08_000613 [Meristemomyces frigidus]